MTFKKKYHQYFMAFFYVEEGLMKYNNFAEKNEKFVVSNFLDFQMRYRKLWN